MERIATAGIYHAWALERRLRYATTYRTYSLHRHVVGRVSVKGCTNCQSTKQRDPLSRRGVVLQDRHLILPWGMSRQEWNSTLKTGHGPVRMRACRRSKRQVPGGAVRSHN